ncbi:heavy metal translocating P-type ATPase [Trebonia kvetii]|uniref:heavy metal translocating P-type ATPase n=1 Tax=Trebonia kvetii TaxID=2480626 RepID=UPI00319E2471
MTAVLTGSRAAAGQDAVTARPQESGAWSLPEVRWAVLATLLFAAGLAARLAAAPAWLWWTFFLACYAAGGWEPGLAGLRALRHRALDVDLLMVVAAIGAAAIGQVLDGGLLIVIFATSGALEAVATHHTERAVRGLLDLAPDRAVRLGPDGAEELVDAAELAAGDVIVVRPGERIAADGQVISGASEVDQATITGEPLPAPKEAGDAVFAGTLNGTGALTIRAGTAAADFVIARIVSMVAEASATKARTQLFIEKVERRYSVGMVAATVALFAIPLLAGEAFQAALLRAMTFMIVASPCAVVLATMPPLLAAMANSGRHGVLVKSAVVMEEAGQTGLVAFDKTGTLTEGTPRLAAVRVLAGAGLTEHDALSLAAAAENPSEHPLARAVVSAAKDAGLTVEAATRFAALPGRGVTATVGGRTVEIGSPRHLLGTAAVGASASEFRQEVHAAVAALEDDGQTVAVMRVDGTPAAVLGIADRLRPAAAETVVAIIAVTGAAPVLLTGDNRRAAARLAAEAGIADVRAELLPEDKVAAVRELEAAGRRVLLAGDGVNDAPALAAASIGAAMGRAGSDLALDTADIVIMRDDLAAIPGVISLSRRARRVVTANLVIAAVIIAALVTWDLAGHLPLPLGVLGHEGSTVIVGLNGLRLLRARTWTPAPDQPATVS